MIYTVIFKRNGSTEGLENLRCPECGAPLDILEFDQTDGEFHIGCPENFDHRSFRIKSGTYRMLPDGDTDFVE
ncbi:MAG: hypothetical protein JRI54_00080 [Deltaproteobacteria bacterium]|nr:hypothetical protein [Deltaproteobacteria bacterium]